MTLLKIFAFIILIAHNMYAVRWDSLNWQPDDVFVFPKVGRTPWIKAIESAEREINISAYKLSDPAMMEALRKAAGRGIKITLLAQPEPVHNEQSGNVKTPIEELKQNGIQVYMLSPRFNQAHYKMIVVDREVGMISTGNLDEESFDGLPGQKIEATRDFAVPIFDKEKLGEMNRVFLADCQDKRVPLAGLDVIRRPALVWGPDQQRTAFLQMINHATKSIRIYQQDFQDVGIAEAVAGAARAGVDARIIMMPFPFSKTKDNNIPNQTLMTKAGAQVGLNTSNYIHAKILIVEDEDGNRWMYVGSCNFYPSSLDGTRELGIVTQNKKQIDAVLGVFESDWKKSKIFEIVAP